LELSNSSVCPNSWICGELHATKGDRSREQMQAELDKLVEAEIIAATNRSASLLQHLNQ
jgi:hypothetical protein